MRRAVERRREQVPLPLPWIPVQQPGQGCPWACTSVAGPGSRRRRRRQGRLRAVGGDRLQDRRQPVVEISDASSGSNAHSCDMLSLLPVLRTLLHKTTPAINAPVSCIQLYVYSLWKKRNLFIAYSITF
ncbi:hypothetical protein VPH35_036380 [Triticum aestivum]